MKLEFLDNITSNKPLLATIYVIFSLIMAFIIDRIFISMFKALVKKSKTEIDDKILDFIHKPIFYSILFFGLNIAINLLGFSDVISFYINGIEYYHHKYHDFYQDR